MMITIENWRFRDAIYSELRLAFPELSEPDIESASLTYHGIASEAQRELFCKLAGTASRWEATIICAPCDCWRCSESEAHDG